jgi:glycosyltransferase involved in cell wall biosynthesis
VSISQNVGKRVKRYYDRESEVIYPPVETKNYKCKDYEDFFLVIQRLYLPKRTRIIVEAFKKMPDKKLIIVGDGPEKKKLENMAARSKNIQFLPYNIPPNEIIDLYSRCMATIYIPKEEDFGFIPVESMASGKPCIGSNEGGVKETIIDRKTGFLIKPTVSKLINAVKAMDVERAESMKKNCIKRAKDFDIKTFYRNWDMIIKRSMI